MGRLGEVTAELRATRYAIEFLPERVASHIVMHLRGSHLCHHPKPDGGAGTPHWMQFLKAALPYVVLVRQALTLLFLWGVITSGAFNADTIAKMIVHAIRGW